MGVPEQNKVIFKDLGRVKYQETWRYQSQLLEELVERKKRNRLVLETGKEEQQQHYLLFCQHEPVYTLGKSGSLDHLLLKEPELEEKGIDFFKINRGGDITYHGPGQLVGYPILDLECFFTDVHRYVRSIEEMIIRTLADYGIQGERVKDYTGVWLNDGRGPKRKICAIGVHLSRWVTMHGFAFNVHTDLKYFNHIVPCGINEADKTVTSLEQELGGSVSVLEVGERVKFHFSNIFNAELV